MSLYSRLDRSANGGPRARPGGRNAAVRLAVARAVIAFLEEGTSNFGVSEVATRAGVHRTTVHRRWPTRAMLLGEALALHYSRVTVPMTGDFAADLRVLAHRLSSYLAEPAQRTLHGMAIAGGEAGFIELLRAHWLPLRRRMVTFVRSGIASGQLRADTDVDAFIQLLLGPLVMNLLFTRAAGTPRHVNVITDAVLRAFTRNEAPRTARRHGP